MIRIVDVGLGNVASLVRAVEDSGLDVGTAKLPSNVALGDTILLPGVGSFDAGSRILQESGWFGFLQTWSAQGQGLVGICLGMQLLTMGSDEGAEPGLGILSGYCEKLLPSYNFAVKVPHVGWNRIELSTVSPGWLQKFRGERFYFSHSFAYFPSLTGEILASTHHGVSFPAIVSSGATFGMQFHPEKSQTAGAEILRELLHNVSFH